MAFKQILVLAGILIFSIEASAQRSVWDGSYNRLGLQGGINNFNIMTNDLPITPGTSWTAGFTTRASFYNDFQFVYGINFYDFRLNIDGREKLDQTSSKRNLEYNMIGVQGNFFGSYKLYDHYLSVEAGPVIQVNGKMEARQDKEFNYVGNYDVEAGDIEKVSPFNINFAVGLSGGFETFKFWVQYQYGLTNILGGLNDEGLQELDPDFPELRGHISMIAGGVTFFL